MAEPTIIIQDKNGKELKSSMNLGIVEAGKSKVFEFFLFNEDPVAEAVDITITIPHKEVSVTEAPKTLGPKMTAPFKVKWSPSLTLREGLSATIKLEASKLYRPKTI